MREPTDKPAKRITDIVAVGTVWTFATATLTALIVLVGVCLVKGCQESDRLKTEVYEAERQRIKGLYEELEQQPPTP